MSYSNFYARFYSFRQEFAAAWKAVLGFNPSRFYLAAAVILQGLAWWQADFIFRHLTSDLLVMHYNVDFGVDLVGAPGKVFFYPLAGLAVLIINLSLALAVKNHRDFKVWTHLLLAAAVIFGLFLSLVLLAIYLINFS